MKKHVVYILSLALAILLLASCTSDYFEEWRLQNGRDGRVESPDVGRRALAGPGRAYAMGDYRDIEVYAWDAMRVTGEKGVAITLPGETQHVHDLSIIFPSGGAEIIKRVSRYDGAVERGEGLRLLVTPQRTVLTKGGQGPELAEWQGVPAGESVRVRLVETGKNSIVIFGCDTVANVETGLLASENTVIRPLVAGDTVEIQGMDLYSLIDWDRDVYITRPSPITGM